MIRFFVDHATTVLLMVFCVVGFGTVSYVTMPRESAPDIAIPIVLVSTPYIGVSPEDIEGLVTIPLENELAGLKGVKEMTSTSAEGVSVVSLKFQPDVVLEDALQKVRDRVDKAKPKLPEDAEEPSVAEISLSDVPVLIVSMAGGLDEEGLKQLAEALEDDLTRIPGVLDVTISGGQTREFRVQVDPYRLGHYGLPLYDVTGALADENVNIPGGQLAVGEGSFLLRVPAEYEDGTDLEGVAIKRRGDRPVFIRDVARVVDGYEDRTTYARMNQQPAVSVSVTKRTGANIIDICDAIKDITIEHSQDWPEEVRVEFLGDQSKGIRNIVSDLQNNILTALILVVGVVFFFMGARNSLFVGLAIPMSMLMSIMVIDLLGYTLNMVVLFSLILALGMLVDNAIVVVENIYRHLEMGKSRYDAAIDGTNEVAVAVAASTATTVAAFFPMVFWTGIIGEFMSFLPKTLIIVLVSSLVVAVVVLPVVASKLMSAKVRPGAESDVEEEPSGFVMRQYRNVLLLSIRWRYLSALAGVLTLFATCGAYLVFNNGTEFFPSTEPDRAVVAITAPDGTDLEATDRVVRIVEDKLAQTANIDVFVAETGVSGGASAPGQSQNSTNEGKITVDFQPDRNSTRPGDDPRVEPTSFTIEKLRAVASLLPGVNITVEKQELGPPVGPPVELLVSGDDFHTTGDFAQKVRRMAAEIPGVADMTDDYRVGRPEMRLRIDRGAAKRVGVTAGTIGNEVRTALAGTTATVIREGEDEFDVVVEVAPEHKADLQAILALRVPGRIDTSPDTFPVPLSTVADYELAGGSGAIRHTDQRMVVTIKGDVADGYNANKVQEAVFEAAQEMEAPEGITVSLGSSNADQQESVTFLAKAMALALALIVLVLVTQFDSLTIPGIIMATVVLSLIGVLGGLMLTQTPFGVIMTGIGVISLAGVVVNNAIVLLDYVGQLRARGLGVQDALVKAGMTRFRPVMLTAVTTVLGLIPMALQVSFDFFHLKVLVGGQSAAFWTPMAVAVIFGLSFATLLTLVMVPTLYSILDDIERFVGRMRKSRDVKRSVPHAAKALLLGLGLLGAGDTAHALTLDEAMSAAERNNVQLQLSAEQAIQTGTLRGQALAALMPKLALQAKYTYNQKPIEFSFADSIDLGGLSEFLPENAFGDPMQILPQDQWDAYANISQPIFSGEGLVGLQAAGKATKAAQMDHARTTDQIRAAAAQTFYGLRTARQAQGLAQEGVTLAEGQLELAKRQVDAGLADRRASLQAELTLARSRRDLDNAVASVAQATRSFETVTGLSPGDETLEEPISPVTPEDYADALALAWRDRPDLTAASQRNEAAKLQRNALWLGWLPSVDFNFNYNYSSFRGFGGGMGSEYAFLWQARVTADWVLWDGGYRRAQLKEYSSRLRSAELQTQLLRREVETEVEGAWLDLATAERSLAAAEREVALASESYQLTQRAVEAGSATWLELQQADLGLRQARLAVLQSTMDRDLAAIDLLVATGSF